MFSLDSTEFSDKTRKADIIPNNYVLKYKNEIILFSDL